MPKLPDLNPNLSDYEYIKIALIFASATAKMFHVGKVAQACDAALVRLDNLNKRANNWASAYPRDERPNLKDFTRT